MQIRLADVDPAPESMKLDIMLSLEKMRLTLRDQNRRYDSSSYSKTTRGPALQCVMIIDVAEAPLKTLVSIM